MGGGGGHVGKKETASTGSSAIGRTSGGGLPGVLEKKKTFVDSHG